MGVPYITVTGTMALRFPLHPRTFGRFDAWQGGPTELYVMYARLIARSTEVSPLRDREPEDEPKSVVLGCVGWLLERDGTAASFIVRVSEPSA